MDTTLRALFREYHPAKSADLSGTPDIPKETIDGVSICGWIRSVRDSNKFAFITISDGTSQQQLQVVAEPDKIENYKDIVKQNVGAAIRVTGAIVPTPERKQPFEMQAAAIEVVGSSSPEYPLQKKGHSMEFLRTIMHLRPRTNSLGSVFRIRSLAAQLVHKFFYERGFIYVHTPIITTSDAEGAGEMFRVTTLPADNPPRADDGKADLSQDFFGKTASLTVSGQLNVEAFCLAMRNCYTFGPTFRAEKSYTPRHAAEFWMIEPEIAFADLSDDMDLAEAFVKYVTQGILAEAADDVAFLNQFVDKGLLLRLNLVARSEFARVTYTDAIEILKKSGSKFEYAAEWGVDLQTEHERYLTEVHFKKPVFVYNYPKKIKAFYMRVNDDGETVAACDMLAPGVGELVGGSQREERYDVLVDRMKELNMPLEPYAWYLDLRKYGSVPHAGFGLGFERLIMYLTGMGNIRDVLPFPRTCGSAEF
ncbi:MAG: asparagine--tRNA ligase [Oscillospiraceae bacterium]|jgi:asparaginyl-tRNA synthetase|nr:asparagine--tRNA ligase [Oscillospiraceae bacterium]